MIYIAFILIGIFIVFIVIIIIEFLKHINRKRFNIIDAENNNQIAKETLIKDLGKTQTEIDIVTGFSNPKFYSDKEIMEAFEKVASANKAISIISGKPGGDKENPLVKLATEYPSVNFYEIETPYLKQHFRIINNSDVFIEREHPQDSDKRFYCYFNSDRFLARKYKEKVNLLKDKVIDCEIN